MEVGKQNWASFVDRLTPEMHAASVSTLPLAVFDLSLEGVSQDQRKATVEEHVLQDP